MGAKKGGKKERETKQATNQTTNHLGRSRAGQGRAGRGQRMWGEEGGRSSEARGAGGLRPLYIINLRSYGGILLRASIVTSARHTCV